VKNWCISIIFIFLSLFYITSYAGKLILKSPAFSANTVIPKQYTCEGTDVSPPLYWQDPPKKTKSFVLIVDDIDAPTGNWVHWILFNIPANVGLFSEAAALPKGAVSAQNSWGKTGYRGPCPPSGKHHYFFRLFALDSVLKLSSKVSKQELMKVMRGHVLETSELIGVYSKE
jgi:Raf kinase inhibitor-like YbhB/YbcL family protein